MSVGCPSAILVNYNMWKRDEGFIVYEKFFSYHRNERDVIFCGLRHKTNILSIVLFLIIFVK